MIVLDKEGSNNDCNLLVSTMNYLSIFWASCFSLFVSLREECNEIQLIVHGLITQFELCCVVYYHAVITQTWLAGSHRRNHLRPDAQTTSIKSR